MTEKIEDAIASIEEFHSPEKTELLNELFLNALEKSETINQGNNGLIKKIDQKNLPDIIKDLIDLKEDREKDSYVFKMLKIYTSGKGRLEFQMQKDAYELVEKASKESDIQYAKIPKPYFYYEIDINENMKEDLENEGIKVHNNKIEIIMMDFIPGEDLATKLFKEVLLKHPECKYLRGDEINEMNIEDLHKEAARVLKYNKPGGKSRDENERKFEENKVLDYNYQLLINFLKKSGYKIDKKMIEAVEKAITLLNKNHIYHRDLHDRNIMIGDDGEYYIIDFGSAIKSDNGKDIFLEGEKRYVQDEAILKRYKELMEDDNSEEKNEYFLNLEKYISKIPDFNKIIQDLIAKSSDAESLYSLIQPIKFKREFTKFNQIDLEELFIYSFLKNKNIEDRKEWLEDLIKIYKTYNKKIHLSLCNNFSNLIKRR